MIILTPIPVETKKALERGNVWGKQSKILRGRSALNL